MNDYVRLALLIVGGTLFVASLVVLTVVAACTIYSGEIVAGRFRCDEGNRAYEILGLVMSNAVAVLGMILAIKR